MNRKTADEKTQQPAAKTKENDDDKNVPGPCLLDAKQVGDCQLPRRTRTHHNGSCGYHRQGEVQEVKCRSKAEWLQDTMTNLILEE